MSDEPVLFVCYTGDHPQYLDALFGPQLEAVARQRPSVTVLSFEGQGQAGVRERIARRFDRAGIDWVALQYHRDLAGKAIDVLRGLMWISRWLLLRRSRGVVHARSHVAGAMALVPARVFGARLVFDIDGSLPDEYVDAGRWRRGGVLYRVAKLLERALLAGAHATIVHTEAQRLRLAATTPRVRLVRHGIDMSIAAEARQRASTDVIDEFGGRPFLVHSGNADPRIYRVRDMARFVGFLRELDPRMALLILAVAGTDELALRAALLAGGLTERDATIWIDAAPDLRALMVSRAVAGLSFRDLPTSAYAIAPVKVAEYLAAGIPVVTHEGIGDARELIGQRRVGVVLQDLSDPAMPIGAAELMSLRRETGLAKRCIAVAESEFGLDRAAHELIRVYADA